jgi:hypothetical protein
MFSGSTTTAAATNPIPNGGLFPNNNIVFFSLLLSLQLRGLSPKVFQKAPPVLPAAPFMCEKLVEAPRRCLQRQRPRTETISVRIFRNINHSVAILC